MQTAASTSTKIKFRVNSLMQLSSLSLLVIDNQSFICMHSFCRQVSAIVINDGDGKTIASKYFDDIVRSRIEKELSGKLSKIKDSETREAQILMVDRFIVQVKTSGDVTLSVFFESTENDILLLSFTEALWRCLSLITGNSINKRKVLERLDQVFMMIDESCERGIVLDDDADSIMSKIDMRTENETPPQSAGSTGSYEGLRNVFAQARGQLGSLLSR